jgi:hypothetical protein
MHSDGFWRWHDWFWRVYDWVARLGFAGWLASIFGGSVVAAIFNYEQWDPAIVLLAGLIAFATLAVVYLAFCFYLDRRNPKASIALASNESCAALPSDIADAIPDLRVADSDLVIALFDSSERDKLLPLLEGERLRSWARPMKGRHEPGKDVDFVILKGEVWRIHYFQHFPKHDQWDRAQTFLKAKSDQTSTYYDVSFNKAQLERIWPEQISLVDAARRLYEAAEAVNILDFMVLKTDTPEEKLNHLKMLLMIDNQVEVLGARPPSTQVRSIPKTELIDELYPAKGDVNQIVGLMSDEPVFVNVTVSQATLIPFIAACIAEAKVQLQ